MARARAGARLAFLTAAAWIAFGCAKSTTRDAVRSDGNAGTAAGAGGQGGSGGVQAGSGGAGGSSGGGASAGAGDGSDAGGEGGGGACMIPDPEQQEICRTLCPPPGW